MKPRDRPRGRRRGLALIAAIALLLGALAATNTLRNKAGVAVTADRPDERRAMLEGFWRMVPPATPVSAAGALLLSGCDGPHDNMDYWGGVMAGAGRPALILDSHGPRGLQGYDLWRLVCAGQVLPGPERAGDLAVALAATRADAVALLGASHGGWTIMELLRQLATGRVPPGLTAWPEPPAGLARRIDRAVLLYPYCGVLNGADEGDWAAMPPILLVAAADDSIVSTADCLAMADALRARGARITAIVLPGVDHGFDQAERSPVSRLDLVPDARDAARHAVERFLAPSDHRPNDQR